MYAILDDANVIMGFEERNMPLNELTHPDFFNLYISTNDETLKLGDIYDRENQVFIITPMPEPPAPEPVPEPQEPPLTGMEQTVLETSLNVEYLMCLAELNN